MAGTKARKSIEQYSDKETRRRVEAAVRGAFGSAPKSSKGQQPSRGGKAKRSSA